MPEESDEYGLDGDGFDRAGFDRDGFDRDGFDINGFDINGFDINGFHKDTKTKYDSNDFDIYGFHKDTESIHDRNGFDRYGINQYTKDRYDRNGFDIYGVNKDTKDKYDRNGFNGYVVNKNTETKYDSNGFDRDGFDTDGFDGYYFNRDGFHKDTDIFLNKKNINWLKNKDEFLKLYNEIIKNGEFSKKINKKNISSYEFKKFMENILKGKVNDNKMIEEIKIINEYENNSNNLKENENINKLKNYIEKLKNSIYGKDKGKTKTEQARTFEDQKGKGYVDLPILLSKLNINSSKELVSNVKQLVRNLYDNKQITKQVYNILNKFITYLKKNL